jgi:hypothetical protein
MGTLTLDARLNTTHLSLLSSHLFFGAKTTSSIIPMNNLFKLIPLQLFYSIMKTKKID